MVIHRCNSCNWPYVYFDVINHVLKYASLIPYFLNRFGEMKIFAVSITSGHWDFLWEDKHTLIQHSYWHGCRRPGEIWSEWVTEYPGSSIRRVKLQTYYHQELFTFHMQSMIVCTFQCFGIIFAPLKKPFMRILMLRIETQYESVDKDTFLTTRELQLYGLHT